MKVAWVHGGCFGGGSPSYDVRVRCELETLGHTVKSLDFATDSYEQAVEDMTVLEPFAYVADIWVGVSSGAALAHVAASVCEKPCVMICPPLRPFDRHHTLSKPLQDRQLLMFGTLDEMKRVQDEHFLHPPIGGKRAVLFGTLDTKAQWIRPKGWKNVIEYPFDTDHDLCKTVSGSDLVKAFEQFEHHRQHY